MKLSSLFHKEKKQRNKQLLSFENINASNFDDDFKTAEKKACTEPYLQHGWVSVCIDILTRNVGRAQFEIKKNGQTVTQSKTARLFQFPNSYTSHFDLWKQTCAWWILEGEAFWWFGENYSCGIPDELFVLNPREMQHVVENGPGTYRSRCRTSCKNLGQ